MGNAVITVPPHAFCASITKILPTLGKEVLLWTGLQWHILNTKFDDNPFIHSRDIICFTSATDRQVNRPKVFFAKAKAEVSPKTFHIHTKVDKIIFLSILILRFCN
jgi:hypothetical protein